jgi:hypothetical protein
MNECPTPRIADYSGVKVINLEPVNKLDDYTQAMSIANEQADEHIGEHMLLSWYDRDRDFESPQHASECGADAAIPGYVDYGLHHGATLKVDFERGRFVFFYMPLDL